MERDERRGRRLRRIVESLALATIPPLQKARNRLRRRLRVLQGGERWWPRIPAGAELCAPLPGLPAVWCRNYDLLPRTVSGHHPKILPPEGWCPDPGLELNAALPYPWDPIYSTHFVQPFQPVKLWRNAIALAAYLEAGPAPGDRARAMAVLAALIDRMRTFTVTEGDAAFIENRFDYVSGREHIPGPWVSAITNAFAILACLRLERHMDLSDEARAYARAYLKVHDCGTPAPARWISYRDRHRLLWFDEYPKPGGQATRVKNGHIFAVLALHELALRFPDTGADRLVRAGATTIEATSACFRRPGIRSRYALGRWFKSDYLVNRAMRQLYQLYELCGARHFLDYGDLFVKDSGHTLAPGVLESVRESRAQAVRVRQAYEAARQ
jgi:hypothetical protein